ncbi:Yip1 family protein [Neobacillus mesonae]|uniref:Yip1 family protein n=1 Tax=Neobacillus mesonae TaxID=1193713 RepID=UPI00203F3ECA|nr:Yip1 family protein [Neobacillus mesonae]MCM3571221.1 YIP1 family protein [Neobacillus mesonae]
MEIQTEMNTQKENPSLIGMFSSPGKQFIKIKENPKFWLPLLIVSVLYVVGMALMAVSMDVQSLVDQGVPKDQAELILGFTKVTVVIVGIVTPIIGILISSAIQLLLAKFGSSTVSFKQLLSMNTFIMIIGAVGLVLNMAIRSAIGGNPDIYITSLAGVLNQDTAGVLGSIEVFGIWSTILTALGLQKTAQLSKGWAWTIAIIFFVVSIGFALAGSAFQGAPQL